LSTPRRSGILPGLASSSAPSVEVDFLEVARVGDRILVVDDELAMRGLLHELLQRESDERVIDEAADGLEGLTLLREREYDIVLTDLSMPRMSGLELIVAARKERPMTPIIAITALGDEDIIIKCFASGAWDYMTKPFRNEQVQKAVKRALIVSSHMDAPPGDLQVESMGPGWLEITAASEIEYVWRFRKFTEVLLGKRVSGEVLDDVRLAVEEIGRNAVEWGNTRDKDKRVHLGYQIQTDKIMLRVEDEGQGFNPVDIEDPALDPIGHATRRADSGKRPGGYGLKIVTGTMDEVRFEDNGTTVVMIKHLY
jgi:CheY-like chemotaxis protein/anti-sigma regulatory factor (Ser/Thr protein kinase)